MAAKETTVAVKIELGHRAKIRDKPNEEGHTHDWMVYVKGADGVSLRHFVEKVVFNLHNSYDQPRRVIKQPPYKVENSGFAGFNMPIELYFRNQEDPKKVLFDYDLFLLMDSMPPVNHNRLEKLTFTNPTEDFRKKLLAAGAVLIESPERHSSKDRPRTSGMSPKKDRQKSREHSKKRESSSSKHGDKKRSTARIAAKDIKRHEEEFKHPKAPESSKTGRDSPGDVSQQERGRSDKKRSASDHVSGKKKKKKHASPSPQDARPKTLNVPALNPAKKEKSRKIKDKPDLMAGLFAPENSINMTQIKQSKDKSKTESVDVKVKKDKLSANLTPVRHVDSPRTEERVQAPPSKSSPTGNLTLKIKKDRISSSKDRDGVRKERSSEKRDKIRTPKEEVSKSHKKRPKENPDVAKVKKEEPVKRVAIVSSSESDMDISPESSPERHKPVVKVEKKVKSSKLTGDSPARPGKSDRKSSGQIVTKPEKLKFDKSNFRKESPTFSRVKDKAGRSESPKPRQSPAVVSKSSKDEHAHRKAKKEKRSSRDKSDKVKSKTKVDNDVVKSESQPVIGGALKSENRHSGSKPSKSSSSEYGKEKRPRKSSPVREKSLKKSHQKPEKVKMEKAPKSRSFIDTDSSSDCDDPVGRFETSVPRIEPDPVPVGRHRAGSASSRSSASSSEPSENTPSHAPSSSSSAASSDEDELQKISESNVAPGRALSPIDHYPDDPGTVSGYQDGNLQTRDDTSDSEHGNSNTEDPPPQTGPGIGDTKKSPQYSSPAPEPGADDLYMSSDEEEFGSPVDKPFEDVHDGAFEDETPAQPDILIDTGTAQKYPHMTQELYRDLQDLQRRLSYITDVDRLCKIARIVDKQQKLLRNNDYLDFDLCTLDERTIHKIKKELRV